MKQNFLTLVAQSCQTWDGIRAVTTRILLWMNVLSLDAPLVALAWQDAAARLLQVDLLSSERLLLGLVTWLVYAGDRLWDARPDAPVRCELLRHRFSRVHGQALRRVWWRLCILTVAGSLLTVTLHELMAAGVMAGLLGGYLALSYSARRLGRLWMPREAVVGAVFTAAVLFFPAQRLPESLFRFSLFWEIAILWSGLGLLNGLAISCWERSADEAVGEITLATHWPKLCCWLPRLLLTCTGTLLLLCLGFPERWPLLLGGALSLLTLNSMHQVARNQPHAPALADLSLLPVWLTGWFA